MITAVILVCFFCTLLISVLFSGAELAIEHISRDSIEKLIENKIRGATVIYSLIGNKRRFQLMLLTGKILSLAGGAILLYRLFSDGGAEWGLNNSVIGIIVFIITVTAFTLTEGLFAKLIAMVEFERTVSLLAYFLFVFNILLFPLTFSIDHVLSVFIKKNLEMAAKEEALIEFVKSESEDGVIDQEQNEMIQGVLDFFDTTVREVMVPRIDMIAVEKDISVEELLTLFKKWGHSRIPVYDGRIDNILGVIYAKDILPVIAEKGKENFSIVETMRKAYYVPETKIISVLLKEFKKSKVHIAIVVDEYGGTAGIVALEDLLEEIVGEIQDEYDQDERDYLWINDRIVLMDAGLGIDDVNEIIHADIHGDDFDTLAGFIYHQLGNIPVGGEEFSWENFTFTIREIIGNRISKVLVKLEKPLIKNKDKAV